MWCWGSQFNWFKSLVTPHVCWYKYNVVYVAACVVWCIWWVCSESRLPSPLCWVSLQTSTFTLLSCLCHKLQWWRWWWWRWWWQSWTWLARMNFFWQILEGPQAGFIRAPSLAYSTHCDYFAHTPFLAKYTPCPQWKVFNHLPPSDPPYPDLWTCWLPLLLLTQKNFHSSPNS